jgi:hypothetical protein
MSPNPDPNPDPPPLLISGYLALSPCSSTPLSALDSYVHPSLPPLGVVMGLVMGGGALHVSRHSSGPPTRPDSHPPCPSIPPHTILCPPTPPHTTTPPPKHFPPLSWWWRCVRVCRPSPPCPPGPTRLGPPPHKRSHQECTTTRTLPRPPPPSSSSGRDGGALPRPWGAWRAGVCGGEGEGEGGRAVGAMGGLDTAHK